MSHDKLSSQHNIYQPPIVDPETEQVWPDIEGFNQAKHRLVNEYRVAAELKTAQAHIEQQTTVTEPHHVADTIDGRLAAGQYRPIDAAGYVERRSDILHLSPYRAQSYPELTVSFVRQGTDGQSEALEIDGRPLVMNAKLYDANYRGSLAENTDGQMVHHRAVPALLVHDATYEIADVYVIQTVDPTPQPEPIAP
jgi:hypothetical protein